MKRLLLIATTTCLLGLVGPAFAEHPTPGRARAHRPIALRMVAYDAKDRRYYSVGYARAHHMHDRGGDRLIIVPFSSLPRDAKMSRAMMHYRPTR